MFAELDTLPVGCRTSLEYREMDERAWGVWRRKNKKKRSPDGYTILHPCPITTPLAIQPRMCDDASLRAMPYEWITPVRSRFPMDDDARRSTKAHGRGFASHALTFLLLRLSPCRRPNGAPRRSRYCTVQYSIPV